MKQADLAEVKDRVLEVARGTSLGARVLGVDVEPGEFGDGDTFLRISFQLSDTENLEWEDVEPLVRAIEDNLAAVDDRFPSIRFADAA